ncbi:hypothetical protein PIB30_025342 [Stylosanthes scabra]|uniref:Leucine-rich repeat-containing N-terminal plant-type domain-containing protein n=1 Tax=Stylosanthes scabra TaxID=79078 RepID=A0ABU6XA83_9FABA|nr:hypothetical protein [Stylosanthes scabra]
MRINTYQNVAACALVVVLVLAELCIIYANSSTTLIHSPPCLERERQALVKFKASLNDPSNLLSSWHGHDCCRWEGIRCENVTGHVVMLDLTTPFEKCRRSFSKIVRPEDHLLVEYDLNDDYDCDLVYVNQYLEGVDVDSSLLELKHLAHLDLSGNRFNSSPIPMFIGSMQSLRYLSLSHAVFGGIIPSNLGNLTNLHFLDLSRNNFLPESNINWISQLPLLEQLDMSSLYISFQDNNRATVSILDALQNMTSLVHLNLGGNNISSSIPSWFGNFKKLEYLDLSSCWLHGPIPNAFQNATSIKLLDLSDNNFDSLPSWSFHKFEKLKHLFLSSNNFQGIIPNALRNMTSIEILDISQNTFSSVPSWFVELKTLVYLGLSNNNLTYMECSISSILKNMCHLKMLNLAENRLRKESIGNNDLSNCIRHDLEVVYLSNNLFNGTIPQNIGQLVNLRDLDASNNYLKGTIPQNIGQLVNLGDLDLSNNNLTGTIPMYLDQLVNITSLDFSNNLLNGSIPEGLNQLVNLDRLDLSRNKLDGRICIDFQKLVELSHLDLSFNNLDGTIRMEGGWQMLDLDMSHNQISGSIPENIGYIMPNLETLLLGNNHINGSIPKSLCQVDDLSILDLSKNTLSGKIPDCWKDNEVWEEINLSSNKLSGIIPSSFGNLSSLEWLHLNNNSLHGEFLVSVRNLTQLLILDLGENQLSGTIPSWTAETFSSLQILRLRQNMLSGSIPSQICQLSSLKILDLSRNALNGSIPWCICNLRGMTLERHNLSFTSLVAEGVAAAAKGSQIIHKDWQTEDVIEVVKGSERDYIRILKLVVMMDLSENNLVGSIPKGITLLDGLHSLNLSNNHLIGELPIMIGNMKSLECFDVSSNQLSGTIPSSMSALTSLSQLNLSHNNLSGPIPTGNQFLTYDPSSYSDNPYLCGSPLPKKCGNSHQVQGNGEFEDDEDSKKDKLEKWLFYFVVVAGFATGFWGVIGTLWFKKTWRHAYFRRAEDLADWIYVTTAIRMSKLKKWMMNGNYVDV